jgi:hypothetical protein
MLQSCEVLVIGAAGHQEVLHSMNDSRYGCFACTDFAGCSIVAGGVIRGIYEVKSTTRRMTGGYGFHATSLKRLN